MRYYHLALISLLVVSACEKPPAKPTPPHEVVITQGILCDVPIYRDYVGNAVAKTSVQVMSQATGVMTGQYFVEGQEVKKGDLLLVIDPRPYEASLAKAEGALSQTYASLRYNQEKTSRYSQLVQEDFVSKLDYDQYVTNVMTDEAQIKQNQAEVETAKINLGYCYISSPVNGVTGKLTVKPGNLVTAAANTALTVVNQIQPILVDFSVPEDDLLLIQEQQRLGRLKMYVHPDPDHLRTYEGILTLIDNQINTSTGAILLEGTLPNEDKSLWPGHFVDVRLIVGETKNALLLPSEAIVVGQNGPYVYLVKDDDTIEMRSITVGEKYTDMTAVSSGITTSDRVVKEGQLNLYPEMKVVIKSGT